MTDHENLIALPPDGGWGWVIVGVAFYGFIVMDAPTMGFQIVQPHIMELLGLKPAESSIIFSAYALTMYTVGPLAGGLCNRFGFRATMMIGCCIGICCLVASFFVYTFLGFLLLYGLIGGCSASFLLIVCCVAPGFWFESKRTIAMGLASSASGISVFTVSLSAYVSNHCGWRWCFILWAGMQFILFVSAFLLAPPPMIELHADVPLVKEGEAEEVDVTKIIAIMPVDYDKEKVQKLAEKKISRISKITGIDVRVSQARASVITSPKPVGFGRWCFCCRWGRQDVGARPIYRKDIFYDGNIDYAAELENKERETFSLTMNKLPTTKDVKEEVDCPCKIPEAVTRAMSEMIDFSLFKSTIFLLILGASIFIYAVRYLPFLLIKRIHKGFLKDKSTASLVTMMGLGTFVSRASIGFVLYGYRNISALSATILFTFLGGLVLCLIPVTHWLPFQLVTCFLGGALPSVAITLRSIIIIDLLGLNKLTSATGILFFIQGFASFAGMPVAEMLNQLAGRHYPGLLLSGIGYIIASLFCISLFIVSKKKKATSVDNI